MDRGLEGKVWEEVEEERGKMRKEKGRREKKGKRRKERKREERRS